MRMTWCNICPVLASLIWLNMLAIISVSKLSKPQRYQVTRYSVATPCCFSFHIAHSVSRRPRRLGPCVFTPLPGGVINPCVSQCENSPARIVCPSSARPKLPAARWRDGDAL